MGNGQGNGQSSGQAGQGLEVILDPRKDVVTSHSGESLDILLRLRAPVVEGDVKRTPLAISLVIDRSGSM